MCITFTRASSEEQGDGGGLLANMGPNSRNPCEGACNHSIGPCQPWQGCKVGRKRAQGVVGHM